MIVTSQSKGGIFPLNGFGQNAVRKELHLHSFTLSYKVPLIMTDPETASEHLKIIRSLMERSTIYRAISAPGALFGGILAIGMGLWMAFSEHAQVMSTLSLFCVWIVVLIIGDGFNISLLLKKSRSSGERFFSPGMKVALKSIAPPMIAGGLLSHFFLTQGGDMVVCVVLWILFYGLALLAAGSFAPRSMRYLGAFFVLAALICIGAGYCMEPFAPTRDIQVAGLLMAATFGVLHIAYAVWIFLKPDTSAQ